MRISLDNGKSYDILAMFTPRYVGYKSAYEALRVNYSAWKNALTLPLRSKVTVTGLIKWLILLILHSTSLLLLPFFALIGCSMKAYSLFLSNDQQKMQQYQQDLKRIYQELAPIEDKDEYQSRLKEEIEKVKPFNKSS